MPNIEAKPLYRQVESAEIGGRPVTVGDELLMSLPGQSAACIVKVHRIDVEDDGSVRDVTVAIWSKKSGADHPRRGTVRTVLPAKIEESFR